MPPYLGVITQKTTPLFGIVSRLRDTKIISR